MTSQALMKGRGGSDAGRSAHHAAEYRIRLAGGEGEVAEQNEDAGCVEKFGEDWMIRGLKVRLGSRMRNQVGFEVTAREGEAVAEAFYCC